MILLLQSDLRKRRGQWLTPSSRHRRCRLCFSQEGAGTSESPTAVRFPPVVAATAAGSGSASLSLPLNAAGSFGVAPWGSAWPLSGHRFAPAPACRHPCRRRGSRSPSMARLQLRVSGYPGRSGFSCLGWPLHVSRSAGSRARVFFFPPSSRGPWCCRRRCPRAGGTQSLFCGPCVPAACRSPGGAPERLREH